METRNVDTLRPNADYRMFVRATARQIRADLNRVWCRVSEVRLVEGDKKAEQLENALRFIDDCCDRMLEIAW